MKIWSGEIKELEKLHDSLKGKHPKLDDELQRLTRSDDENIVLVYARRCLEVIITDLCERELQRDRGTEPLKGIIDKLNREKKVPHNIIVSMQNLNSLSSFGAHPKDFDPMQVKPVLLDLTTTLKWYLKYMETQATAETEPGGPGETSKVPSGTQKRSPGLKKRILLASAIVLVCAVVVVALILTDVIKGGKGVQAGDIKSLVVLPFGNYTGADSLEYFVDGMHSSLITDMGKIGSLLIPGKTTSKAFKNSDKTIEQITSEIHVDAALETDVLCLGDSICLQVRLIQPGKEEKQLWVADYRVERSQILNLYNRITRQIADEIIIELTPEEERLFSKIRTVDREAYDAYLRSHQHWDDLSQESLNKALEYLNLAVEKDPDFAPIYAGLATVWAGLAQLGFEPHEVAGPKIFENLDKAIELDPDFHSSHYTKAVIGVWQEWDWEKGEREFKKALEINPNDAMSRIYYAHFLFILKRFDEAYFHSQMAYELDPMNPLVLALSANVDYHGRIQQSLEKIKKALEIDPEHHFALLSFMDASYFNCDYKNSIETELKICPGLDDEAREAIMAVFQDKGYVEAINTMLPYLEEYARTNYMGPIIMGKYYYRVGNLDKSIEYYIKAYEMHDPMMPYFTDPMYGFNDIKDDPRIISIVEKMNLPFAASN